MKTTLRTLFGWLPAFAGTTLLLVAAGCAEVPKQGEVAAPKPAAPQITEDVLRKRAEEQLAQGVQQYQAGEYDNAVRTLTASLDHGMLSKADQARARKFLAFSHCVSARDGSCRAEFRKAFEIYPEFALTPAEDGHPIWGPVYRDVRAQLIAEREASQGRKSTGTLGKAEQMLADGMVKYDAGDYAASYKLLEGALKEGLKDKADQVRAMKHLAFNLCLQEKYRDCRGAFIKIYDVDPEFDLTPAEAGHPSWTRTFAGAKAQAKRALKDKEVREAREKAKAPPAAAVPKK
ncbi:MAG TPA: TssQ family T6SS-associated lipoprotein [Usitatibacter sp.]|nr:TssQ family T6SS-associated lipoprotein [Usitatibacter sp.]